MQKHFTSDKMRLEILSKVHYKLVDYIYNKISLFSL